MRVSEYFQGSAATCWQKASSMDIVSTMKSKHSFARNVLLMLVFGCAIFISTIAQGGPPRSLRSNHHFPPGRLTVDRAPNFGWNLGFNLQIDGRPVTTLVQGHSYSTWLSAGPHVLTVLKVPAVGYTAPTWTNSQHSARRGPSVSCHVGFRSGLSPAGRSLADARRVLAKSR